MKKNPAPPSVNKTMRNKSYTLLGSLIISIGFFILYHNIPLSLLSFCIGMFLDADHLFDYFLYMVVHKKSFSLKEFLSGTYFLTWKKFITPGHSWEVVIASLGLFIATGNPLFNVIAFSLAGHYFVDYMANDVNKLAYFFIFRLMNGFKKVAIRN